MRKDLKAGIIGGCFAWILYILYGVLIFAPDPQVGIALFLSPVFGIVVGFGIGLVRYSVSNQSLTKTDEIKSFMLGIALIGAAILWLVGETLQYFGLLTAF